MVLKRVWRFAGTGYGWVRLDLTHRTHPFLLLRWDNKRSCQRKTLRPTYNEDRPSACRLRGRQYYILHHDGQRARTMCSRPRFNSCPPLHDENLKSLPSGKTQPSCTPDGHLSARILAKLLKGACEAPGRGQHESGKNGATINKNVCPLY